MVERVSDVEEGVSRGFGFRFLSRAIGVIPEDWRANFSSDDDPHHHSISKDSESSQSR
jgi:hypothetical protein